MAVIPIDFANLVHVSDESPLVAYRITRVNGTDADIIESLRSNHELQKPPRGVEIEYPRIHEGISSHLTARGAAEYVVRWPKLGEYIVRLELDGPTGASSLIWGNPGHLTIWCDALTLRSHVTDTLTVQEVLQ